MSSDPRRRTLGEYVEALVQRLREADAPGYARLARLVAPFRAQIGLDDEAVLLCWQASGLVAAAAEGPGVVPDGCGSTDRQTVLAILDGRLEVTDAILDGRIELAGPIEAVERMLGAIEILIDAGSRAPSLQVLEADFRLAARLDARATGEAWPRSRTTAFGPAELREVEHDLLARLDLLPSTPTRDPAGR